MEKMKGLEIVFQHLIGEYGWIILSMMAAFLLKDTVENLITGFMFLWGTDFDEDDIVWIGGKTKARIVRQTITKTVFYIYETNRKLVVPNKSLYSLKCEKALPTNGDEKK
tara:strand:+ start:316 stop:645 length:330 start_codon:yes stop_codon:yes gene_type:complete